MQNYDYLLSIVFHDDNAETVEAIARAVPKLQEIGIQLVTLTQLDYYRQNKSSTNIIR